MIIVSKRNATKGSNPAAHKIIPIIDNLFTEELTPFIPRNKPAANMGEK